jgi:signal transduction histidine kinase/DNA-binding response OmpR family regulator
LRVKNLVDSRILIVDDQVGNLIALQAVLEFAGYTTVRCLSDSRQVLSAFAESKPDLILLDLHMPHVDGLTVLDQLAAVIGEDDYVPVLVLSGDVTSAAKEEALARGANDYLSKPLNSAEVRLRVGNLLQTRYLHLQLKTQNASLGRQVRERTDLTEQLIEQQEALAHSEETLRGQSKLLQSILNNMGDGVLVADRAGKILLFNPAARHMIGEEAIGTPYANWNERFGILRPGTASLYPANELPMARAMRGENVDAVELFFSKPIRGGEMYISVTGRPLKDDLGNIQGGVSVFRDITPAKQTEELLLRTKEEAERANRAKSEFLSRMSHELRTPLNSILGFAQLLDLGQDLTAKQRDSVQRILKGGYHLLDLINEVLDLARIEAGRLSLSVEPVRVQDALRDALDLVEPLASQQQVTLDADSAGLGNLHVQADRQRLQQVLLNLLSNAIKYNHSNGSVLFSCDETEAGMLRLEIADTGCGIDGEGLKKLFLPFERLEADRTSVTGTGLGLALSKRLVEAMGGTIGVESTLGVGSRFSIELPLVQHAVDRGVEEELSPPGGPFSAPVNQTGTVLYIEDNPSNLRLLERILVRYPDVKLLEAMLGALGVELATLHNPDWILLDLHLPDMPGDEVLRRLRENPATRNIPVTVLSADATPGEIDRLVTAGAREYLTKPLNVRKLIALLEATMPQAGPANHPDENIQQETGAVVIPAEFIDGLRDAVQNGEKNRLDDLIAQVAVTDARSAHVLNELADNYDYGGLSRLLEARR